MDPRPSDCSWISRAIIQNPGSTFAILLLIQTLFVIATVVCYLLGSDIFPADFTDVPLILKDDPSYMGTAAWNSRFSDPSEPMVQPNFVKEELMRQMPSDTTELYYITRNGQNILTVESFRAILDFENQLLRARNFKKYCVVKDFKCLPTQSLPRIMEEFLQNNGTNMSNLEEHVLQKVILSFAQDEVTAGHLKDFLEKNAIISPQKVFAKAIRSYIYVAWIADQAGIPYNTKDYASEVLHPVLYGSAGSKGLPRSKNVLLYYHNPYLYFDYLKIQVIFDLLLAVGSFTFVSLFLWLQTRVWFISFFGIYGILSNFFGANLIYRYIFDYHYFGVFHVLSVFIILGIGVDDIFVFHDAWRANVQNPIYLGDAEHPGCLGAALDRCYRTAARSLLVTSSTTAACFFVNAFSPLLAIGSFGLFSGILISLNYLSIVTYFASVIVFHHIKMGSCCSNPCRPFGPRPKRKATIIGPETIEDLVVKKEENLTHRRFSMIFCGFYYTTIRSKGMQLMVLLLMLSTVGMLAYTSCRIEIDERPVRLYRESHFLGKSLKIKEDLFNPAYYEANVGVSMYFVWGIQSLDRSHCHKTDWKKCHGQIIWDDNFDLNSYPVQKDFLTFCKQLRHLPESKLSELKIKMGPSSLPEVRCFADDMDGYFQTEWSKFLLQNAGKVTGFPVTDLKIHSMMTNAPHIYDVDLLNKNPFFYRFFETANLHWLHSGYDYLFGKPFTGLEKALQYSELLGHSRNSSDYAEKILNGNPLVIGTRLRYAAVQVNTTLEKNGDYRRGLRVIEAWVKYMEETTSKMSPSLRNGFIATPDKYGSAAFGSWHWFRLQQTLTQSAISGTLLSLALVCPVLIISTNNLLLGTLASITIACSTISAVGIIPLLGWKLGVLESLNLTLVVGLAVDYIVHIAEAYHISGQTSRLAKVEELLKDVGISVVSGAASTLGASFFMLFAQIVFFMQFGIFIFCIVAFTIVYSVGLFIVLLCLLGPETTLFNLDSMMKACFAHIQKAFSSDEIKEIANPANPANPVIPANFATVDSFNCGCVDVDASQSARNSDGDAPQSSGSSDGDLSQNGGNTDGGDTPDTKIEKISEDDNSSSGYESAERQKIARDPPKTVQFSDLSDIEDILSPRKLLADPNMHPLRIKRLAIWEDRGKGYCSPRNHVTDNLWLSHPCDTSIVSRNVEFSTQLPPLRTGKSRHRIDL